MTPQLQGFSFLQEENNNIDAVINNTADNLIFFIRLFLI
jgi:hypothetical protein